VLQLAYNDLVASIEYEGGRVLAKSSVVIVHRRTERQLSAIDNDADSDHTYRPNHGKHLVYNYTSLFSVLSF